MRLAGSYPFKTDPDPERFDLRVLSLGAGVQSTRLLLGILEGEFGTPGTDAPACAVFADTGWEPRPVYEHLAWLLERAEAAGFPIHIASAGHLRDDVLRTTGTHRAGRAASIPLHTTNQHGQPMMMRRQCTREYKIEPIERTTRQLLGLRPRARAAGRVAVESWQGLSWDELQRLRVNPTPWVWNRYPLVERRETRADCLRWLEARGITAPKSACVGCPYHDNAYWLWLKEHAPEDLADAIAFDERLAAGALGWDRPAFLHRSRRRLRDVIPELEVLAAEEAAQGSLFEGMAEECEGICGV